MTQIGCHSQGHNITMTLTVEILKWVSAEEEIEIKKETTTRVLIKKEGSVEHWLAILWVKEKDTVIL